MFETTSDRESSWANVLPDLGDRWGGEEELTDDANPGIEPGEYLAAFAVAMGVTFVTRQVLELAWQKSFDRPAPKNPTASTVDWKDALLWGGISGAVVGVARIASRRATSQAYREVQAYREQ